MFRLRLFTLILSILVFPALVAAQFDTDHPGYFPIEDLGILPEEAINLEINLPGSMLKFIAAAIGEEDPDFSRIAENLKSIRVRGADLDGLGVQSIRSGFDNAARELKAAGWISMVRVRDDDEEVFVFFKEQGGEMVGLTVFTLEDQEAMMVNLVGNIDPSDLSGLAEGLDLDLPDMGDISGGTSDED